LPARNVARPGPSFGFTQAQYPTMKKGELEVVFDLQGHSKPLSGVCD
jgi:hypothetical protein